MNLISRNPAMGLVSKTVALALMASASQAETESVPAAMKMSEPATHDQLSLALRKADQLDPMKNLAPAAGEDPSMKHPPRDILSDSDIISFRGLATLVPKRAILQIPKNHAGLVKLEPGAKIVSWADFYAANRNWITTVEVSRVQAEGNQPIAEETRKFMSTSRNLIVATYHSGPISVLPLKEPAPDAAAETTKQSPQS